MGKKNKEKRHQKQRQKASLEAKHRVASRKGHSTIQKISETMFSSVRFIFWLAHGVNYLLSDYSKGTWTPLFDSIYEGHGLPKKEEIAGHILLKFGKDGNSWPLEAKAALAWVTQPRPVIYAYYRTAIHRLKERMPMVDPERACVQACNSVVWELFHELKETIVKKEEIRENDGSLAGSVEEGGSSIGEPSAEGGGGAAGEGSSDAAGSPSGEENGGCDRGTEEEVRGPG